MLARFSASEGSYFSIEEINRMQEERENLMVPAPLVVEPFWIVYDFAKVQDRTVVMTGGPTPNQGVVAHSMYEYPQGTGYNVIIDDLKEIVETYGVDKIAGVAYDATGVGKGIEDFMKVVENMGVMLTPVDFTIKRKTEMATLLKLLVEKNLREPDKTSGIKVPKDAEFHKQMNKLIFKRVNGQLKVHHEKESDRDDYFDALMILCRVVMNLENVPVSVEYTREEIKEMNESLNRCECGNILEAADEFCSFCFKDIENWQV